MSLNRTTPALTNTEIVKIFLPYAAASAACGFVIANTKPRAVALPLAGVTFAATLFIAQNQYQRGASPLVWKGTLAIGTAVATGMVASYLLRSPN